MAEIELKLAVPAAALTRLGGRLRALGKPQVQQLDTTYFDTAERLLASQGIALRLRRQGRQWVQTLKVQTSKANAALSTRAEWEVPTQPQVLEIARFPPAARQALKAVAPQLIGKAADQVPALQRWFRTRFRRTAWLVEHQGAQIEVALDEGEIVAGKRRAPLLELELELKSGAPAALLSLALRLVAPRRGAPLPLVPLPESKAGRGARLADGVGLAVAKAQARRLSAGIKPSMSAAAALRSVLHNGLEVVLANAAVLGERQGGDDCTQGSERTDNERTDGESTDGKNTGSKKADSKNDDGRNNAGKGSDRGSDAAEAVHQARVALRRMRSAVRLLGRDADLPPTLVEEMHWLAGALGPARDADVLLEDSLPPLLASVTALEGAASPASLHGEAQALLAAARARQQAARGAARAALRSARFGVLALRLMQWCDSSAPLGGPKLRALAARRLARAQDRLIDAARFFCALAPAERHRVRILAKRLRYAVDLFASALPARRTAAYVESLSALQDQLGRLNDAAVALQALPQLINAGPLLDALSAALDAQHASPQALVDAERQLAALAQGTPPWRGRAGSTA